MNMRPLSGRSLWGLTAGSFLPPHRFLSDGSGRVRLADFAASGHAEGALDAVRGKSVLISFHRQLPAALALLQLDGVARRILLCPPDLRPDHVPGVVAEAAVDVIVSDETGPARRQSGAPPVVALGPGPLPQEGHATEWLLFTSGTTGRPKIVAHTLASLTGPLDDGLAVASDAVWATFYDIRRYGGLQILLRALLGGASMVLSRADEAAAEFLQRAGQAGVTHISGTPSHWRRALMSAAAGRIAPDYVRLSGEVADQAILDNLAAAFPRAQVAHAFASTEAGVAFDVRDGLAGFPAALIGQPGAKADMRVQDGSLRIRSPRTASGYLGSHGRLADADGFVDTGDLLDLRGDRYHFIGRREGIINVGGQKVHPEEVEGIINRHPAVRMAHVWGRRSPITGSIVVADVVVHPAWPGAFETLREEVLQACRGSLPRHKVPAILHQVPSLDIAASGKLARRHA